MLNGPILTLIVVLAALIIGGLGYAVSAWPKKVFYEKLHTIDKLYSQAINNPYNYAHRPQIFAQVTNTTTANLNSITNDIDEINKLLPQASEADDVHTLYKKADEVTNRLKEYATPPLSQNIGAKNLLSEQDISLDTTETIKLKSYFRDLQILCWSEDINKELKNSNFTLDNYYDKYVELYTHIANSTSHEVALLPNPHELSPQETIAELQYFLKSRPIEQGTDFIKYYQYKVLGAYSEEEWEDYQLTKDSPELRKHYERFIHVDELYHQVLTNYVNYIYNPEFFSSTSKYNLTKLRKRIDEVIGYTDKRLGEFKARAFVEYFTELNKTMEEYLKERPYTSTRQNIFEKYAQEIITLCSDPDFGNKVNNIDVGDFYAKYAKLYVFMGARSINRINLLPNPQDNAPQETLEKLHIMLTHQPVASKSRFYAYCTENLNGTISYQGFDSQRTSTGNVQVIHGNNNVQIMGSTTNSTRNTTHNSIAKPKSQQINQAELFDKIAQLQQSYYHVMTDPEIMITAPIIRDTGYNKVAIMEEDYAALTAIIPEDKDAKLNTPQYNKLHKHYTAAQSSFDAALEYAYIIGLNGISHHDRIRARVLLDKALDPSNEHEAQRAYEHLVELLAQVYTEDTETNYKHYFNPTSMPELSAYTTELKSITQ